VGGEAEKILKAGFLCLEVVELDFETGVLADLPFGNGGFLGATRFQHRASIPEGLESKGWWVAHRV
jgi:hypothetical protein